MSSNVSVRAQAHDSDAAARPLIIGVETSSKKRELVFTFEIHHDANVQVLPTVTNDHK